MCTFFCGRLKAARLDNIFLTRLSWENVGGLSGQWHQSVYRPHLSILPIFHHGESNAYWIWYVKLFSERTCLLCCRDDINLEGHRCPWMCPLWASTAGEKLNQTTKSSLLIDLSYICFFLSKENYLDAIKSFSGPLEDIKLCMLNFLNRIVHIVLNCSCIYWIISSQRFGHTLRSRTQMRPWQFIRCRSLVSLLLLF